MVTFASGMTVRERIVTLDEVSKRLVWSSEGGITSHYNASVTLTATSDGSEAVWVADFLPDEAAPRIAAAMDAGISAMQRALDALAPDQPALF
jgi:polyketide cyclase/dehydrase/lipid transport protein